MRHSRKKSRSIAFRSELGRRCPSCYRTDALNISFDRDRKSSTSVCRFCGFTETKGRNVL